jgi:hypothetical protein
MAGHRQRARKDGAGGKKRTHTPEGQIAARPQDVSKAGRGRLSRKAKAVRKRQRYGHDPQYRERTLAHNRGWWAAHKDEINERNRHRYATDPEYSRRHRLGSTERGYRYQLKTLYGISISDYQAMLAQQDGRCAICRARPVARRLAVDHDNLTGFIRGLLCSACNLGIGNLRHSPALLRAAADYLDAAVARARADPAAARYAPVRKLAPSSLTLPQACGLDRGAIEQHEVLLLWRPCV